MISHGIKANRPEPINPDVETFNFRRVDDSQVAIEALQEGRFVLIEDFFSTGLDLLNELQSYL